MTYFGYLLAQMKAHTERAVTLSEAQAYADLVAQDLTINYRDQLPPGARFEFVLQEQ